MAKHSCFNYHELMDKGIMHFIVTEKFIASPHHCAMMEVNGRCKIHGQKRAPLICRFFPMVPSDDVYLLVKKWCGFKFKKVKNKKYRKKKADKHATAIAK